MTMKRTLTSRYKILEKIYFKITDPCEYYDEIDLRKYVVSDYELQTEYKLFSVLVHSGTGAQSGHYYAFIRPNPSTLTF